MGLWLMVTLSSGLSPHRAMLLLSKYGYLTIPSLESLNNPTSLIVDGSYKKSIKKFQQTFNLPQTGILSPKVEQMLTAKRCGNPDIGNNPINFRRNIRKSRFVSGLLKRFRRYFVDNPSMKWLKHDLTWKIRSDAYPSRSLSKQQVRAIITMSFNMWAKHVNLNFAEQTNPNKNADIIIEFGSREHGDSIPFDGENSVLAHAFYPSGSDSPAYSRAGDAHFDDDENWINGNQGGRNLLAVAVHELGHSMGLGHSATEKAIMYPFYINPSENGLQLDQDDIDGMVSIYGKADPNKRLQPVPDNTDPIPVYTRRPAVVTKAPNIDKEVDFCNTTIDAIILIRGLELNVFKGRLLWRIDFSKTVTTWISYEVRDGPGDYSYYWPVLPKDLDGIDGGIERKDQKFYIFKDERFWLLENNLDRAPNVPVEGLPLEMLGLPSYLTKIDTIFRWGYNHQIYIMAGNQYWKINEDSGQFGSIFRRYPRRINDIWKGVPTPIDVAYTGLHGRTFFIKDKQYYEFNNLEMKVSENMPQPLKRSWIGCKFGK